MALASFIFSTFWGFFMQDVFFLHKITLVISVLQEFVSSAIQIVVE